MYKNWNYDPTHDRYVGVHEIVNKLPSGYYKAGTDQYDNPAFKKMPVTIEDLYLFKNGPMISLMEEINKFWSLSNRYEQMGVAHKRGFLLHGKPGCGKTGIISYLIKELINQDGIAIKASDDITDSMEGIKLMRQIESNRKTIIVIEDIDRICRYYEESLLEIMDGVTSTDKNLVFICTTNYLHEVPPRIKYRPSRIDTLFEIEPPCPKQREEYLNLSISKFRDISKKELTTWVRKTKGLSLAQLKECVISTIIYENDLDKSIEKISMEEEEENE